VSKGFNKSGTPQTVQSTLPAMSVIVPCRNEKDYIAACVRSILAQEPPPGGFEIIIVDGMSDDGTRDILKRLVATEPLLRTVDNPRRITPCGMNVGIREARGRYIAIMGAHNRYAPEYLCRSMEVLEETGADNVGGAMICEAESWLQRAIAAAHHSPFAAGNARWHNPDYEGPADTVFGGLYRREVFERIGLFDEELVRNQDDEFNLRLQRAGGKIWQSPRIKSWYKPRASLRALFKQYKQYGYWKVRVIQKHKLPASVRHLIPGCFVLSLLLSSLASLLWPPAAWCLLGLGGAYSTCNLAASLLTAARQGWVLFPLLPPVFACYHFGYGYGFLRGMGDFVLLRRGPKRMYTELTRTSTDH
jgi:succinoglycan biosynthesis protein ExoA